jgi:hypothetical protein
LNAGLAAKNSFSDEESNINAKTAGNVHPKLDK